MLNALIMLQSISLFVAGRLTFMGCFLLLIDDISAYYIVK